MGESRTTDFSVFDGRQTQEDGRKARLIRYLGQIVSAASVLPPGAPQLSPLRCRRRPKRRRCPGRLEVGWMMSTGAIEWRCGTCSDSGTITNWRDSRWDLSPELDSGQIVSLSAARARRAQREAPATTRTFEVMAELIDGPLPLEQIVMRKVRISGESTLHDLHRIFAESYGRDPEDPYEFMFGALYEVDARRFTGVGDALVDETPLCETQQLHIDELGLRLGQVFGYLSDFDAEWVHRLTVVSIGNGPQGASVIERVGDVPTLDDDPDEEDDWNAELVWEELDDEFPLTELYGPYDGDHPPDRETWDSMEELERLLLVLEGHSHSLPKGHCPIAPSDGAAEGHPTEPVAPDAQSGLLHAVLHQLAEAALCRGDAEATEHLARAQSAGLGRHEALHEIGERLALRQIAARKRR